MLALLLREAQKVAKEGACEAATAAGDERGPPSKAALEASVYLRRLEAKPEVYAGMEQLTETYFECIATTARRTRTFTMFITFNPHVRSHARGSSIFSSSCSLPRLPPPHPPRAPNPSRCRARE